MTPMVTVGRLDVGLPVLPPLPHPATSAMAGKVSAASVRPRIGIACE
jgi:hypothetical protein